MSTLLILVLVIFLSSSNGYHVSWSFQRTNLKNCLNEVISRASLVAQMVKNLSAMQEIWVRSLAWEDSPGGGHNNQLQYSCLENPMDRGAWWVTVHGVAKIQPHDWATNTFIEMHELMHAKPIYGYKGWSPGKAASLTALAGTVHSAATAFCSSISFPAPTSLFLNLKKVLCHSSFSKPAENFTCFPPKIYSFCKEFQRVHRHPNWEPLLLWLLFCHCAICISNPTQMLQKSSLQSWLHSLDLHLILFVG